MDIQVALQEAKIAVENKNFQLAQTIYKRVIQENPRNFEAWLGLADIIENPDHARQCLERVLKLDPGNQTAILMLKQLENPFSNLNQRDEVYHAGTGVITSSPLETIYLENEPAGETATIELEGKDQVMMAPQVQKRSEQTKKKIVLPEKKSTPWLEIFLGTIVVIMFCVVVVFLLAQNLPFFELSPKPTLQDPRMVIIDNQNTANAEDLEGYMETIHPRASGRLFTRTAMQDLFDKYDLRYEAYGLEILEQTEEEARVAFTLVTRKIRGPAFQNNRITGIMILRLYKDSWKIYDQEISNVTYLN